MNRENRLAILKELVKSAQSIDDDISSSMGEFIPYSDDQFGHHKVFMEDYNTKFSPTDINQAIEMSNKSDWITIPEFARRSNIPNLYILDEQSASLYEKYFGVKTEYGFLDTPISVALRGAIFNPGKVHRFKDKQPIIEVPPRILGIARGTRFMVLDPQAEAMVSSHASRIMERAQGRPEHVGRVKVDERGTGDFTATHQHGKHIAPGSKDISPEISSKMNHLNIAIDRFYREDKNGEMQLRKLHSTIDRVKQILDGKMDDLISEQRDKNRALRFEFKKDEYEDLIKQSLLRILIAELTGSGGPFEGTNLGIPSSLTIT